MSQNKDRNQPAGSVVAAPAPADRPRCRGTRRRDGQPCGRAPMADGWCWRCSPNVSDADKQAALVKGGTRAGIMSTMRAKAADIDINLNTPADCKRVIEAVTKALVLGVVTPRQATALNALVGTAVKISEVELELALLEAIDREKAALGVRK